jgi:hypothetical protein
MSEESLRSDLEGAEQVIARLRQVAEHEHRRWRDEADGRTVERGVWLAMVAVLLLAVVAG